RRSLSEGELRTYPANRFPDHRVLSTKVDDEGYQRILHHAPVLRSAFDEGGSRFTYHASRICETLRIDYQQRPVIAKLEFARRIARRISLKSHLSLSQSVVTSGWCWRDCHRISSRPCNPVRRAQTVALLQAVSSRNCWPTQLHACANPLDRQPGLYWSDRRIR